MRVSWKYKQNVTIKGFYPPITLPRKESITRLRIVISDLNVSRNRTENWNYEGRRKRIWYQIIHDVDCLS